MPRIVTYPIVSCAQLHSNAYHENHRLNQHRFVFRYAFREPLLGPTSSQTQTNEACAASGSSCVYYKSRKTVPFVNVAARGNSSTQHSALSVGDSQALLKWSAALNGWAALTIAHARVLTCSSQNSTGCHPRLVHPPVSQLQPHSDACVRHVCLRSLRRRGHVFSSHGWQHRRRRGKPLAGAAPLICFSVCSCCLFLRHAQRFIHAPDRWKLLAASLPFKVSPLLLPCPTPPVRCV
jgi:hypothetical protein